MADVGRPVSRHLAFAVILALEPSSQVAVYERTRAVSTRYVVPAGSGHDVLSSLRQWHTAGAEPGTP